jgi:glycosyltransferase involved in cell wall biosynthesis
MIKVVINNRNRLTTTKNMVEKLLVLNPLLDIIILDNGSTYPPLLEWYKTIHCQKYFLENQGHLALWSIGLDKKLGDYFVYTDSDIILNQ